MELLLEEYGAVVFFILFFTIVMVYFKETSIAAADGTLMDNYLAEVNE